jgi:hypothetical protein
MEHLVSRRDVLRASSTLLATGLLKEGLAAASPLRFGLVTDIHYADIEPAGARTYRESPAKLAECVRFMNAQQVDFLAELGDFKDQGKPPSEGTTIEYLQTIEKVFRGFEGERCHVLGNHDLDSLSKRQFVEATRGNFAGGHLEPPTMDTHYAFELKGLQFVVLDGNFRSDGTPYDHGNYEWADANVPAAELAWLDRQLSGARVPVVVLVHQQLDGEGAYYVKNASAVRETLERHGKVLAVFQGHRHEGGYSAINGIHYYTLKGVIEGSGVENSAFAVVEADASFNLTVTGYRKADSRTLRKTAG